jgi:IS30 family transposase
MAGILTHEQKQLACRLRGWGWRLIDIAREIGCTAPMVGLMVREGRYTTGVPDDWEPRRGCLSIADREELLVGIRAGESLSAIAGRLGRVLSVVTREVAANGGREGFSAWAAHRRARQAARRPKPFKLRAGPLLDEVTRRLEQLWSPDEIARRSPLDFPDDAEMRVSHETIYQSLFVQGRGELRRELARSLRSGRTCRKKRGTPDGPGRIPGLIIISDRPAEVDDRAVPGHWEGDLILGSNGRSAVGTLVERTTRLVLLLHLEDGRAATSVARHARGLKGDEVLALDHYLEVLAIKTGAFAGATALARARAAGVFGPAHERFWAQARRRLGDRDGTRALIEVLLLHRSVTAERVAAGIEAALGVGSVDPAVVAIEARRIVEDTAVVVVPIGEGLNRFDRPAPSIAHYDQLLEAQ